MFMVQGALLYSGLAVVPFLEFHFNISADAGTPGPRILLPYETALPGPRGGGERCALL